MADLLLDSDVVVWHLRGRPDVVEHVTGLSSRWRIGVSAITRAEVLAGARPREFVATVAFLDACETVPVGPSVADRAAEIVRRLKTAGETVHLPDALIAATALEMDVPLHTCNDRHYRKTGVGLRVISIA